MEGKMEQNETQKRFIQAMRAENAQPIGVFLSVRFAGDGLYGRAKLNAKGMRAWVYGQKAT